MLRFICLLMLYLPVNRPITPVGDPVDNAVEYLKANNIHELAKAFTPNLDITILADDHTYTAAQAEAALTTFFKSNPIKSVTVVHRVNSNPNIRYAVLSVFTGGGVYRTSISLKLVNGTFLMNEVRVEAEKK